MDKGNRTANLRFTGRLLEPRITALLVFSQVVIVQTSCFAPYPAAARLQESPLSVPLSPISPVLTLQLGAVPKPPHR